MKKLVQINVVCNGSTGKIMTQIQQEAQQQGWEAYSFYGRGKSSNEKCIKIDNIFEILYHVFISRFFGLHGHGSYFATKRMINKIKKIDPDVIQIHNIHGYYLNIKVLFKYLKQCNKKIVWTLHDCWSYTGHCPHYIIADCYKWQKKCYQCVQTKVYPKSMFFDTAKSQYELKSKLFTTINNMTLVTPSSWLKKQVDNSFLKNYPIHVINNGIDLNIFHPTNSINVREKYNIPKDKKIILGVSAIWNEGKGLNDFIQLSKLINDNFLIILVGLNNRQIKKLPNNIIGITRTENQEELANFYTIAHVLFNPSKEETFSLVTIEAIACGTPVIAYNSSAVKELIVNDNSGLLLKPDKDLKNNFKIILDYLTGLTEVDNNLALNYSVKKMTEQYINLYENR